MERRCPTLDGITYRLIVNDSVRAVELKSHNIDLMAGVAENDLLAVQADPALNLVISTWSGNTGRFYFNARGGPFADNLPLRQATLYVIDRELLAKTLAPNDGVATYFILQPGQIGYDASLPHYTFDLPKAKALMVDAGYPNGIDVHLLIINREQDQKQAQILQPDAGTGWHPRHDRLDGASGAQRVNSRGHRRLPHQRWSESHTRDPDLRVRPYLHSSGSINKSTRKFRSSMPPLSGPATRSTCKRVPRRIATCR